MLGKDHDYTKSQQRKKEESERLRGGRDQIKFIDLRFERWQVVGFKGENAETSTLVSLDVDRQK